MTVLKPARVKPLLKKPGLDVDDLNNFRPVSNLPFLSKILEKVVRAQLESHLSRNNLREACQPAYRQNYSTETLLLSVTDSLLCKADNRFVSLLTLLDQSATFDTIDHKILLNRLSYSFGISVKWFISYLTNRTQSVSMGDINSSCYPCRSSSHSYCTPPENTKQCSRTCPPKIKKTTCHSTSQTTILASDSNTH